MGVLVGEVEGVSLKGVEDCMVSINLKFEMLNGGLMSKRDGELAILDGINVRLPVRSKVDGSFFVKHPKLSLMCP